MFLQSSSIASEEHHTPDVLAIDDDAPPGELMARVRSAFPQLRFDTAVVEERGGDHRMLLLDAAYAFRFPREKMHDLGLEIAVLAALSGRCNIAVPEYRFVDPAGQFAGYPLIEGDELTPQRFAALPSPIQQRVLDQAGGFLAALHSLEPEEVLPAARWPVVPSAEWQIDDARTRCLPRIARTFPHLGRAIAEFYDSSPGEAVERQVVLQGDLVDDHILLAPDGLSLAGIIDFGDVALGDPAHDLRGFWAYGVEAVARVIAAYRPGASNDLRERSYRAFIRYRIERFFEQLATDSSDVVAEHAAELAALLSAAELASTAISRASRKTLYLPRR